MDAWRRGGDPFAADVPLHPSYEDREGAPDRVYADVDDADFERQVAAWSRALIDGGVETARVAHLHHLTPISEALQRLRPELPLVVTLHGTEMNMLEAINRGDPVAERWRYAPQWADRMRTWAARADRVIVDSPTDKRRAMGLFDVAAEHVSIEAPGVDSQRFHPQHPSLEERLSLLRRWLVDDPRGWDESGVVGSVRYTEADLAAFADPDVPVLIFVGRFTEQKRLPLLIRAYGRARREFGVRAPLLVWGGFPVEYEGEHPVTVARNEGVDGVFFTGWRGHDELPHRARLRRRFRRAFGERGFRAGLHRGDGVRPSRHRGRVRWPVVVRQRRAGCAERLARRVRRRGGSGEGAGGFHDRSAGGR